MIRRPHPDGGPDIRDDEPLPPPFPVGTRLRMKSGPWAYDAFVQNPELPYPDREQRENLVRIRGAGIEVVICRVRPGHRGSGRLMETQDDGYEVYDSTKDGWSVYEQTYADGRAIPHSGRAIAAEDADHWEVLSNPAETTKPMRVKRGRK
jgi:hypothetical protein